MWDQGTFGASEYGLESLVAAAREADFAVLVATPDDTVTSRDTTAASPRDNVLFELGLFMGALGVERVFILSPAEPPVRLPSDLAGLTRLKPYGGRQDGDLGASLTAAVLEVRDAIAKRGARAPEVTQRPVARRAPDGVRLPVTVPLYGLESLFADEYPGRFMSTTEDRPAVHLRAVWRPTLTGSEPTEFKDADSLESVVPSALFASWVPFYSKNGGVGGEQTPMINGRRTYSSLLVADQDLARSLRAEPEASVRAAIGLLHGEPALHFVADLSLAAKTLLPLLDILTSLRDLAIHAAATMPKWLERTHGVPPAVDGVLELHAMGTGHPTHGTLESCIDLAPLGPRSKSTRIDINRATQIDSLTKGSISTAVADSVLRSLLNWGYLGVPKSFAGAIGEELAMPD